MIWDNWRGRWITTLTGVKKIGGDVEELSIGEKATNEQIAIVEQKLGYSLPESFKRVMIEFSSSVSFSWYLPDGFRLPDELKGIFSGQCNWNIDEIIEIDNEREDWVKECFPDVDDEYDRVWHNKLAFMKVPNGDFIAFDLDYSPDSPIVYLSHDGCDTNGYVLGENFIDFIDNWSLVGCPGTEDWQITPFIESPTSGIDPQCANAIKWRELMDFNFSYSD